MIDELGRPPVCRQIPDVQPSDGHEIARVRAAEIKNIERMLVAGTHYTSTQLSLPEQVGMDAVAELIDGHRVYAGAIPPGGTMAEYILVDPSMTAPVPDDVDDASATALPNAGVSAWLSPEHTGQLRSDQSVLVPRTQPPGTTSPFRWGRGPMVARSSGLGPGVRSPREQVSHVDASWLGGASTDTARRNSA